MKAEDAFLNRIELFISTFKGKIDYVSTVRHVSAICNPNYVVFVNITFISGARAKYLFRSFYKKKAFDRIYTKDEESALLIEERIRDLISKYGVRKTWF